MFGRIALVGIVFFSLFGCSDKKECIVESSAEHDGNVYVFKKNACKDNALVSEQWFLREGESLIADGLYRDYYENGNLESEGYYKRGKEDSIFKNYYEDGIIKAIKYKSNDHFNGPQYEFYENGAIKGIVFVNMRSEIYFEVRYDTSGNMTMSGVPIKIIMSEEFGRVDSVIAGEMLAVLNEVPLVYKARTRLRIELQKDGKVLQDTTVTEFVPVYNVNIFGYGKKLDKPGTYDYVAHIDFLDSATGKVIRQFDGNLPIRVYDRPKK